MANATLIAFDAETGSFMRVRNRLGTDLTSAEPITNAEQTAIRNALAATATEVSLGVIRVTDAAYGAIGNGVADDTTALTAAITAATNGATKVLLIPPGTYKTNALTFPSTVKVWFLPGAILSVNSGQTVTINGPIESVNATIFSGAGTVVMGAAAAQIVFPQWWGATGDGSTDDTDAIQAALDAAGVNRSVIFPLPSSFYKITSGLTYYNGQRIYGYSGGAQNDSTRTRIVMSGTSTDAILSPANRSADNKNVQIQGLQIEGGANTSIGVEFYRTSWSTLSDCHITTCDRGHVIDANTANQAYFNSIRNNKIAYNRLRDVTLRNGANDNTLRENTFTGTPRSVDVLSLSTGNSIIDNAFQGVASPATTEHIYLDAGETKVHDNFIELASIGIKVTANGRLCEELNTWGGGVTTKVSNDSFQGLRLSFEPTEGSAGSKFVGQFGGLQMSNEWTAALDQFFFALDRPAGYDAPSCSFNFGYNVTPATLHRTVFWDGTNSNYYIDHKTGTTVHNNASAKITLWATEILQGNNSPEGVVTAAVGSIYLRRNGGAGSTLYVKESGSGNTGWVAK